MTTYASGSAKIYAFPRRGRFLGRDTSETLVPLAAWEQPAVRIATGSGWYHDEAIAQERQTPSRLADPRRKN